MKIAKISLISLALIAGTGAAGLLASGVAVAKQPAHHMHQYYGLYQGSSIGHGPSLGFAYSPRDTAHDYPFDGLHPTPQQRASYWHP